MTTYTTLITVDQLAILIKAGQVALFDCSFDLADPAAGYAAFLEGHLPGARYLHLDDDLSGPANGSNGRHPLPAPDDLAATLRAAGLSHDIQVIAYDMSGGAYAARLWWLLRWLGHDAVAVLDGAKQAWIAAGREMESGPAQAAPPGDFVAPWPREERVISASTVLENVGRQDFLVIDARSPARFRGEPNALDPVAGHIPGAANRFYMDNLADGLFKPAPQLAEEFDRVLAGTPARDVVLQCGSGVTACHDLLALEVAGKPGARLYPGSWSEWISDPSRPVERS